MNRRIVRPLLQQQVDLILTFRKVPTENQKICQLNADTVVLGLQFEGSSELGKGSFRLLQPEITLCQLVVSLRASRINLHRVEELNRGLSVLTFLKITLAALEIPLFAHLGIPRARRQKKSE